MNRKNLISLLSLLYLSISAFAQHSALEGRWDITINKDGQVLPSWMEVRRSGDRGYMGRFVSSTGSARPIAKVNINGNAFRFNIPPQWEKGDSELQVEGILSDNTIKGSVSYPDGTSARWEGTRAPALRSDKTPQWGKPITLFNGNDLAGWHTSAGTNQWVIESGVLKSPKKGTNLITDQSYSDFKLHIEFRIPKNGNSGVYLRGRYETQIADSKGLEPWDDQFGGIYGFLEPIIMVAKDAGEWQMFDITLVGRVVTVVANGITVVSNQVIPGVTGGALDSNEGEPGPLMLQGDHEPVEFRNIVITPAK